MSFNVNRTVAENAFFFLKADYGRRKEQRGLTNRCVTDTDGLSSAVHCRRPFKMPKWKRLLPESDGGAQHGRTKRTEKGGGVN